MSVCVRVKVVSGSGQPTQQYVFLMLFSVLSSSFLHTLCALTHAHTQILAAVHMHKHLHAHTNTHWHTLIHTLTLTHFACLLCVFYCCYGEFRNIFSSLSAKRYLCTLLYAYSNNTNFLMFYTIILLYFISTNACFFQFLVVQQNFSAYSRSHHFATLDEQQSMQHCKERNVWQHCAREVVIDKNTRHSTTRRKKKRSKSIDTYLHSAILQSTQSGHTTSVRFTI